MSDDNKVVQRSIQAKGDVAGRDMTKYVFNGEKIVFRVDHKLKSLITEHENEVLLNKEYREFSEKLNHFLCRKAEGKLRDLGEKLSAGGRDYLIDFAMEAKERAAKKIAKNSHYESAQKIYTHLLTEIRTAFFTIVVSRIKSNGISQYDIDDLIRDRIINPLLINVDGCRLDIDMNELYGLLYILTGNCHIEWD